MERRPVTPEVASSILVAPATYPLKLQGSLDVPRFPVLVSWNRRATKEPPRLAVAAARFHFLDPYLGPALVQSHPVDLSDQVFVTKRNIETSLILSSVSVACMSSRLNHSVCLLVGQKSTMAQT